MIQKPNQEIVEAVNKILDDHRVAIPYEHVDMVVATMSMWLETNKRGHEYMAHLLQMSHHKGSHAKRYILKDGFGRLTEELEPENIIFLQGCSYKGDAIPLQLIHVTEREFGYCDSCGTKVICDQNLKINGDYLSVCSACLHQSGEQELKDQVKLQCETCNFGACSWNPRHENADAS